jgi:hypothetical protein
LLLLPLPLLLAVVLVDNEVVLVPLEVMEVLDGAEDEAEDDEEQLTVDDEEDEAREKAEEDAVEGAGVDNEPLTLLLFGLAVLAMEQSPATAATTCTGTATAARVEVPGESRRKRRRCCCSSDREEVKPTGLDDVEEDGEPEAVAAVLDDEGCWDESRGRCTDDCTGEQDNASLSVRGRADGGSG